MTYSNTFSHLVALLAALLSVGCLGAPAANATPAEPISDRDAMASAYRAWLDQARTPVRAVSTVVEQLRGHKRAWTAIDAVNQPPTPVRAGDRVMFVTRDRSLLLVIIGREPIARAGARLIGAHIDTPLPRVSLISLKNQTQVAIRAHSYGSMRLHHWVHRPLALVGQVARASGEVIDVALGLDDDFALYASQLNARDRTLVVTTGTIVPRAHQANADANPTLMSELNRRYGIDAGDLQAAELFLVPKQKARDVGLDRALIGAHGQDDRVNSYAAWRALMDIEQPPRRTAMVWLVDREEVGSRHAAGGQSQFLELALAYLLRAQGSAATEATLARAFAASQALSADTPAALNPNWPEVHEPMNAPVLGKGPAVFPFTGRGGKRGGNHAHAAFVREVIGSFERAQAALQHGQLGRVDEGGSGTIAKYLAERGIDVVDIGIPVISMHSPVELVAKDDLLAAYRGFRAWLQER